MARRRGPRAGQVLAVLLAVAVAGLGTGCAALPGRGIRATDAWARAAERGETSALYLVLENRGTRPVRLVGVDTDVAEHVELHRTVEEDGAMRMEPVEAVEVPPGGRVELAPGGYHVMLAGLRRPLRAGERFPLTLRFDDGQTATASVEVR